MVACQFISSSASRLLRILIMRRATTLESSLSQKNPACQVGLVPSPHQHKEQRALREIDNRKCVLVPFQATTSHTMHYFGQSIVGAHTRLRSFTTTVMNLSSLHRLCTHSISEVQFRLLPLNIRLNVQTKE